ncbi:GNAT family N-acetyltransferase [Chromobacterium sphagni]|uniref:GNAT family N-acetyltransferase n=1 Tax=Chromobacterium sphagni TaxID=1903179 RepID=A0A1S1WYD1_9NEIS|nr:GNAT family N-acetyltransferase [Chromobacterium sphagni]OHX12311.1 GNAT family N-acetyltransferase [Chromobacterium sphagni]OHX21606.1 GNAT family N-acetyltransferase [Chromobacterium sphagni]
MQIRDANLEDLAAILDIYNEVIATTTAVYNDDPLSAGEFAVWFQDRTAAGCPVLLAEENGRVLGFSSFSDFRPRPGYRFTVEHSVHLAADARGKGIGTALVQALFPRAQALGKHTMLGAVDADNEGSIRFHEKLGFAQVGRLPQVGFKFGRWLDLVYLQRFIDGDASSGPASGA